MANGKIRFGKQSGGQLALVIPDGVDNTEVTFPESGILAKTSDINTAGVELKTIATGTASFDATTNNINLTGIGIGLEIGDVIQISGAEDAKNNSEFTVEVITDDDNIIVNQIHTNHGTSKNVATRAGDTEVTVKLLAKWYNGTLGVGQGWNDVLGSRSSGVTYINSTGRPIFVVVFGFDAYSNGVISMYVDKVVVGKTDSGLDGTAIVTQSSFIVPSGSTYEVELLSGATIIGWKELR